MVINDVTSRAICHNPSQIGRYMVYILLGELPTGKYQILVYSPGGDLKATIEEIQVTENEVTKVDISLTEVN